MDKNEAKVRKHRKSKFSYVLILLLLVCIAAFVIFRYTVKSKLQDKIEAIRAAGYPVTSEELDKWYSIPEDAENAAYIIMDAFSYYQDWDKTALEPLPLVGQEKLPTRTEPLTQETKTLIAQYLSDNQKAIELLHEAALIEHSRYPIDLSLGAGVRLDHLGEIRKGVRLLSLEVMLHSENKQPQLAARSVISMLSVANSLKDEPLNISQRVRWTCQALGINMLERAMNRTEFTDEQLHELGDVITKGEDFSVMSRAFAGERCNALSIMKMSGPIIPDIAGPAIPPTPVLELYKALGLADLDAIVYIDFTNDYIEATKLDLYESHKTAKEIEVRFQKLSKIHLLTRALMPSFSRIIDIHLRNTAHLRAAGVALAIERYRLAEGKLPETLTDLVPAYLETVPDDPFDSTEMKYKKLDKGYVVYSVGDDLTDNGGQERMQRQQGKRPDWDITFIIER
jgi:hypothetical protein